MHWFGVTQLLPFKLTNPYCLNTQLIDLCSWNCVRCVIAEPSTSWSNCSVESKMSRMGIVPDVGENNRKNLRRIKSVVDILGRCSVPPSVVSSLKANPPNNIVLVTPMDPIAAAKHSTYGRVFETSMLMYETTPCDCCGHTQPCHIDPFFPSDSNIPVSHRHLNNKCYKAWRCNCLTVCHGEQFYATSRVTQIRWFTDNHNSTPWDFLNLNKEEPNSTICQFCYFDVPPDNNLDLCRKFSSRNGFGPGPLYDVLSIDPNVQHATEMRHLLSTCTLIEEAAIRQITPLVSILKLAQGNIGTKGNTSCVWINSKIATVLPNLPSQCKYIILKRSSRRSNVEINSMKFERRRIMRILQLFKLTLHEVWGNITISNANMQASIIQLYFSFHRGVGSAYIIASVRYCNVSMNSDCGIYCNNASSNEFYCVFSSLCNSACLCCHF